MLVAVTAGCGSSSEEPDHAPSAASTGPPRSASSAPPEESGADKRLAEKALKRAVDAIVREPVTDFRVTTLINGRSSIVTEGFALAGQGWQATSEFTNPTTDEPEGVMFSRARDGAVWMQMREWPQAQAGCWLLMSPTQVPLGILALTPVEPTYISLLGYLRTDGFTDPGKNFLSGELDLGIAMRLFPGQLVEAINIDHDQLADRWVEAEIGLRNDRVTSVLVLGSALKNTLEAAGGDIASEGNQALPLLDVSVNYAKAKAGQSVQRPHTSLVVSQGEETCH